MTLSDKVNPLDMQAGQRYLVRCEVMRRGKLKPYEFVDVFCGFSWRDDLEEIRYSYWTEHEPLPAGDITEVFTAKFGGK